jgi:hypothetical protein
LVVVVASDSVTRAVGVNPAYDYSLNVGGGLYTTNGGECLQLKAGSSSEKYIIGVVNTSETATLLTPYTQSAIVGTTLSGAEAAGAPAVATVVTPMSDDMAFFENPGVMMDAGASLSADVIQQPLDPEYIEMWRAHTEAEGRRMAEYPRIMEEMEEFVSFDPPQALEPIARISDAEIAEINNAEIATIGDAAFPSQTLTIRVMDDSALGYTEITTQVGYYGTSAIFLEDVANPIPVRDGTFSFSNAEFAALDATLTDHTLPVLNSYFGGFANGVTGLGIEVNLGLTDTGRIGIVITKEVNKGSSLGFVDPCDLFARSGSCLRSDFAELFYGLAPDPAGEYDQGVKTVADVLNEYPSLIAHETAHIIQRTQDIYNGQAMQPGWSLEGGASLAEQLVGNSVLGHGGSGQNLGVTEFLEGQIKVFQGWYAKMQYDLVYYLGWDGSTGKVTAPEQCTWLDNVAGTPCLDPGRNKYGPPATLLRMILDRHGASYPGGESALMREITGSTQTGFTKLSALTGASEGLLMTLFGLNLYIDGRQDVGGLGWHSSSFTSWNLNPILQNLGGAAGPAWSYSSSAAEPNGNASVRAGSTAYLEWSPSSSHAPTGFRIRTQAGADLPPEVVLWIFRIQWGSLVYFWLL